MEQHLKSVRPMHLEFVESSRRHAHIVIPEGADNVVALDLLAAKIAAVLD